MTINRTRWSPDTCECVIEYSWDDSVPAENRTHSLYNVVQRCPAHNALSSLDIFSTLMDENPRKNNALSHVLDNGPTSLFDTTSEGARVLKGNITFNFSWSGTAPDRVLTINFTGINLTQNQKNSIQTFLNNRFGSGKVLIA